MHRLKKVSGWTLFASFFIVGNILGCTNLGDLQDQVPMPEWISGLPASGDSFAAVGVSGTGEAQTDRARAVTQARSRILDAIAEEETDRLSAYLRSRSEEVDRGLILPVLRQALQPLVPQAAVADTWTSPEGDTWVYLTLSRREWQTHRREDRRTSIPVPSGLEEFSGMNLSFLDILRGMALPLQFLPGGRHTPFRLSLSWDVAPVAEAGRDEPLQSVSISAVVLFEQYGVLIARKQYGPLTGSGKTAEDAREAGAFRVLELLRQDEELPSLIREMVES